MWCYFHVRQLCSSFYYCYTCLRHLFYRQAISTCRLHTSFPSKVRPLCNIVQKILCEKLLAQLFQIVQPILTLPKQFYFGVSLHTSRRQPSALIPHHNECQPNIDSHSIFLTQGGNYRIKT